MVEFKGFAVCSGDYGDFTVPILETDVGVPSEPLSARTLLVSSEVLSGRIATISEILGLITEPMGDTLIGTIVGSYPEIKLVSSVAQSTGVHFLNIYVGEYLVSREVAYNNVWGYPNSPVIFKLLSHDGLYLPLSSTDADTELPNNRFEFFFTGDQYGHFSTISRVIPIKIPVDGKYPSEPDNIIITPSLNFVNRGDTERYTAVYKYSDGTEIKANKSNALFEVEKGFNSDNLNGILATETEDGLSVYVSRESTANDFRVKVTWFGSNYNVSKDTITYIGTENGNNQPYTPGINSSSSPSWTGGGGGNFGVVDGTPETSDPIEPFLPGIGTPSGSVEGLVSKSGLFVHYAMDGTSLKILGDWLWANELGLAIAKEFISLLYGSPIESAISLMSYPFDIKTLHGIQLNSQEVYWGGHASGVTAPAITNPYATIDWGTVQLTEFWGNFLDYAPHTKLELYLPWCTGFVPIDPNECLPGTLRVVTNIELAKGTCLHNVIGNDRRVIATHAGTCGKQLPLTALDTSGKALQLVTTAASAIVAGASGAAADAAGSRAGDIYRQQNFGSVLDGDMTMRQYRQGMSDAVRRASSKHSGVAKRAENRALSSSIAAMRTPSSVQRSGSFSGASAGLGVQFPYLIISRPTQSVPAQYGHHYGYPSNIYTPLEKLRGYTEVGEIHLSGFLCTEEELEEIDSILKGGVIL